MATIAIEIPISLMDQTEPALSGITRKLSGLEKTALSASQGMMKSGAGTSKFLQSVQKVQSSMKNFSGSKYQAVMEVKDKASSIITTVTSKVKAFAGKTWGGIVKVTDMATKPIRGVLNLLKSPLMAAGITLSIGGAVASSVKTFAGFESTMSEVKAIAQPTNQEFEKLTQKARDLGATTKFTAQESAEAMKYMGMAGWKAGDMMGGIGGILNLAAASGEDLGRTSDIVTDSLTAFNMKASDATHFSDVLAQAATNSNTNVSTMGETFKYAGTMAGALGYSIEDVGIATGLMANAGIKGTMAGTALNGLFTRLATNTNGARDAITELGVEFFNADGSARSFSDVMVGLRKATAGMTTEQKTNIANTIAGERAQKGLLAILNASQEDYDKLTTSMQNADGAAGRMSETMMDNLSGRFTKFTSALDGLKVSLGQRISPYLEDLLEWATDKMPDVEKALMNGMDSFDEFFDNTKEKIAAFTGTADWENADLFGKIGIAWDKLVAEPFGEWWDGSGHQFFADKAQDIGKGIGTGISTGILALLGIDISGVVDDGASIGASFAKGFSEGFDMSAIGGALKGAIGGIFKSAGGIFGGDAGLSNWISAMLIGKVGMKVLGGIGKIASTGSTIFGSGPGQMGLGSAMIGSAAAGTGLLGLGANTAISLGAGNLAGGASLGAGALSAVGLGSIAGGAVGAFSIGSGLMDAYHASKSNDEDEKKAYNTSTGLKMGGVAAGAAAGAAIGSVVPVLGTAVGALIGAGLGGAAGMFAGNKTIDDYKEQKAAAEEAAYAQELMGEKRKYALEGATFQNKKLKEAFNDTEVSASQFGQMMQEATSEKIRYSFGDISLSMNEIRDAAKQILFNGNDSSLTGYADAAQETASSIASLQKAVSNMARLNWKAGLGMVNDDESITEYKTGITNLISEAQNTLENEHYQATAAIDLLVEPGSPVDMTSGLNDMYGKMQENLSSASEKLHAKLDIALEDGKIDIDEQTMLDKYQKKVTEITDKITGAQTEASMQALQIKYSGSDLSAESFTSLTSELQAQAQEAVGNYDEALEVSLTNLKLQLNEGAISQDQYDTQLQTLTEGYQAHISDLAVNVESFQLNTIADAFGSELDNIMPGMEGTVQEKLAAGLQSALDAGVDVESWTVSDASKFFNFDGLDAETASAVTQMLSTVAATIPDSMDPSAFSEPVNKVMNEGMQNIQPDPSLINTDELWKPAWERMGDGLSSGQIDTSSASEGMSTAMQSIGDTAASTPIDMSGVGDNVSNSANSAIGSADFSGATASVGNGVGQAVLASFPQIQSSISSLYSQVGSAINSAFSAGFSTSTSVRITANYSLANPTATISFSGGGSGSATVHGSVSSHAEGGMVNGAELSWVGEDGPEMIIPLGGKRRKRGIDLWKQAGKMMGISEHAEGGVVGGSYSTDTDENLFESVPVYIGSNGNSGNTSERSEENADGIQITINMDNNFDVGGEGASEDSIVSVIRSRMKEIANELGGELAGQLSDIFENTPA